MNMEAASQTGPWSLVAGERALSPEALWGPSCRCRTLVILGIVTMVLLAGCGGSGSQPASVTPTISMISPNTAPAGGVAFTLTITGTNFVAGSIVNFGGSTAATTFVSSTQLTASIPSASIASAGMLGVTVINPPPGGGTSGASSFNVTAIAGTGPMISLLLPSCAPAGESLQLSVVGTNFMANSVVRWNGNDRPTTMDTGNSLVAQISASDVATAGTAAITVFNSGTGGGTSSASTFTVTPGAVDPQSIAVDPAGKFAYVASSGCAAQGYVSMYTINSTTGALTPVAPPVPTHDENTSSVSVDPSGKFVYVTKQVPTPSPWILRASSPM